MHRSRPTRRPAWSNANISRRTVRRVPLAPPARTAELTGYADGEPLVIVAPSQERVFNVFAMLGSTLGYDNGDEPEDVDDDQSVEIANAAEPVAVSNDECRYGWRIRPLPPGRSRAH